MAVGVDDREDVGAFFGNDLELVLAVGGLAQIFPVQMPVERGLRIAVRRRENNTLAAGIEGDRSRDTHAVLRINDLNGA